MPPVTRCCESTMLIDCPTDMSVSSYRLSATARSCPLWVSPRVTPAPLCENGARVLRRADDIARQRMVLPRKWRGGVDDHPRVRVQLALVRRDRHVDPAALCIL